MLTKPLRLLQKPFNEVLEKHAPSRVIQNSIYYIPYISDKIREAIDKRDKLKNKAADTGDKTDFEAYKTDRNNVKRMLRNAKKNYHDEKLNLESSSLAEIWKVAYSLL